MAQNPRPQGETCAGSHGRYSAGSANQLSSRRKIRPRYIINAKPIPARINTDATKGAIVPLNTSPIGDAMTAAITVDVAPITDAAIPAM